MEYTNAVGGAGAERMERAPECRQHPTIIFRDGCELRIDPITGAKLLIRRPRHRREIPARFHVPGLTVIDMGCGLLFEWMTEDCVDASDCVDAQCRAGWNDDGYGFGGLEIGVMPDGRHRARWGCSVTCE